ncbi:MAG: P-loop NTPase [Bacteroidales bacterium]|nr:P-loop NTPase [Bacteroidales bacterium]
MKQITIISGKGGTGKTTLTAAFASMAQNAVVADCDVDAADLYLVLKPEKSCEEAFPGGKKAIIDQERCVACGICMEYCRFDAINFDGENYIISGYACEGCELCTRVCPVAAIGMKQEYNSKWFMGETRFGPMVYAKLGIGEDLSGKLVTRVREEAKKKAKATGSDYIIIDGPPGVGCPVIAAVIGTDAVVIVTEPTQSGLADLKRVNQLARHFEVPAMVIINKYDLNDAMHQAIEQFCTEAGLPVIARLPFDKKVVEAMIHKQTINEYDTHSSVSLQIMDSWKKIVQKLEGVAIK